MIKLENWTEITKGLYRYVVAASCCYEIHIIYHAKDTDILTANASLYIVGDWCSAENNSKFFERKLLLNGPLAACLEKAVEDNKDIFKQALEKHNLTVGQFLDLRYAWNRLGCGVRSELLKEEILKDEEKK